MARGSDNNGENFQNGGLYLKGDIYNSWGSEGPLKWLLSSNNNGITQTPANKLGIEFLVPPEVNISHSAEYNNLELTHTNHTFYSWKRSSVGEISVMLPFVNVSAMHARYYMGAIHFLRTCTRGFLGESEASGAPPPILSFSSFGPAIYNDMPVFLKQFTTLVSNAESDFIKVDGLGNVPVKAAINLSLLPAYSPNEAIASDDQSQYARGRRLKSDKGKNSIEGFY